MKVLIPPLWGVKRIISAFLIPVQAFCERDNRMYFDCPFRFIVPFLFSYHFTPPAIFFENQVVGLFLVEHVENTPLLLFLREMVCWVACSCLS